MSLGKQKFNNPNAKFYSVSFKTRDKTPGKTQDKSVFVVKTRDEAGKFAEVDKVFDIGGNLIKVEPQKTEWQGKTIESMLINLVDGDDFYAISFPYGIATRAFFNALLSLKTFEGLEIGTYMTKPKSEGGKSYPAIALRQNGELIKWKYSLDDLPKVKEITFKGQTMRDYSETDAFFNAQLVELNKTIKAPKVAVAQESAQAVEPEVEHTGKDSEVPF